MKQELHFFVYAVVCLLLSQLAIASDGAIPIWEPTTITASGSYVVTRDIQSTAGAPAIIVTTDDVTIDMKGHTISGNPAVSYSGTGKFAIMNGRLKGGEAGFYSSGSGGDSSIKIKHVAISGWDGIKIIGGGHLEITSCNIRATHWGTDIDAYMGIFTGNTMWGLDNGCVLGFSQGAVVRNNVIFGGANLGLSVRGTLFVIESNEIRGNSFYAIHLDAAHSLVLNNTLRYDTEYPGLVVDSDSNRIAGNVIKGGIGSPAIDVYGSYNLIEGNNIGTCSYGIYFQSGSQDNAYRNNMIRNVGTAAVGDAGSGNTDAGGNIL